MFDQSDDRAKERGVLRVMLAELRKRTEQNSFNLREVEAMIREAKRKGPLDQMQMSMNGVELMARTTRDAVDASLMLMTKIEEGLNENEELRRQVVALKLRVTEAEHPSFSPSLN